MKETQIISKYGDIEILAQILDGQIAMITDDNRSKNQGLNDDSFLSDNDCWIFALYKALKEVDKKGGFDHLKKEEDLSDLEIEKFYV